MDNGLESLDVMFAYVVYPAGLLCAIYFTLIGFKIIKAGTPSKAEEAYVEKRLTMLRWLGPLAIILQLVLWIGTIIKIHYHLH